MPLSLAWDGRRLLFAPDVDSSTVRSACADPRVRVALGPTRTLMRDGIWL